MPQFQMSFISHVIAGNSPCLPSSREDIPAKHVDSHGKESSQMINVHVLIGTMHSLSELLLFHCSNEENELKKQDFEALKNVVRNLDKCLPKNIGHELSADPNKVCFSAFLLFLHPSPTHPPSLFLSVSA